MKFFQQLSIGALASFSTLYWVSTTAAPAGGLSSSLVKRGYIDAGIIKELLNVIGVATSDDTEAWVR
jgi:hypothetical protein